jgi:hypothetical protein
MNSISPYNLQIRHICYIEEYFKGVRTNKFRGTVKKIWSNLWCGHNVIEFENMIEYVDRQETISTERDSPTFPGNTFYVHVNTNKAEERYWLFYKPVAAYLMTTQVLRQCSHLDKVSICGLYKQHFEYNYTITKN